MDAEKPQTNNIYCILLQHNFHFGSNMGQRKLKSLLFGHSLGNGQFMSLLPPPSSGWWIAEIIAIPRLFLSISGLILKN